MKVLVIEDDKNIAGAIEVAFEFRWPEAKVICAMSGKRGISLAKNEAPDVVILDINLPDLDGFEVLKAVREFSSVPVIILTVRFDDADVLKGLELGADDYIIKPFNYMTLLARVKAVLRRTEGEPFKIGSNIAPNTRLSIDLIGQKVRVDNQVVKLTPVEYKLLILLVKNKNKTVEYRHITEEIWGTPSRDYFENVRIYIRRLRNKLHDVPPNMILNRHGLGYMFKS